MPIISYDIKRQRIVTTKTMVSLVCIDLKGKKTDRACIQMQNSVYLPPTPLSSFLVTEKGGEGIF